MPVYEYECMDCGKRFEKDQKISDAPIRECPSCHGSVRRLISGGTDFILKGSGWESKNRGSVCSQLEREGKTCCGRDERCDSPACEGDS